MVDKRRHSHKRDPRANGQTTSRKSNKSNNASNHLNHQQKSINENVNVGGFTSAYAGTKKGTRENKQTTAQYSRNNPAYSAETSTKDKKIKIVIIAAIIIALLVAGIGVASAIIKENINRELEGNKSKEELAEIDDALAEAVEPGEPFYIMLIGSDERASDESMGARSDTNIVARVEPKTKKITMVSIPRDTAITINGSTQKFNAALAYSGAAGIIKQASNLCGVKISHYAEINFGGLTELVDAVGGVDVYIESTIDDPDAGPVVIPEGMQHLDGQAALVYARTRQYADGDFTRVEHQRVLIEAIANKVLSMPVADIIPVVSAATNCVTTDLKVNDIINLVRIMKEGETEMQIYSATIPATTGDIGGLSYVFANEAGTKEMFELISRGEDPSEFVPTKYSSSVYANQGSSQGSSQNAQSSNNSPNNNTGQNNQSSSPAEKTPAPKPDPQPQPQPQPQPKPKPEPEPTPPPTSEKPDQSLPTE